MTNRILLINPGHDGEHAQHKSHRRVHRDPPPLGLLYVATALKCAGYEVDILDTHVEPEWRLRLSQLLAWNCYLWAGLTVIIGQRQRNAAEVTHTIHHLRPQLPVYWGGTMPTIMGEQLMKTYSGLTDIVKGEGEYWSVSESMKLQNRSKEDFVCRQADLLLLPEHFVEMIVQMSGNEIRLRDKTPFFRMPDWRLFKDAYNHKQLPYFHMLMTSRGCPMHCTFCYKHTATGGYRLTPLDDVQRQMETMHAETGTRVWTIGDDNFLGDGARAVRLLQWMKEKSFYFEEVIGHIGQLTEYIVDAMAGVVTTFIFSVESASPRLQRIIKKGVALDTVPMKMGWLAKHGIVGNCSFIFGLPTETQRERNENDRLMQRIRAENDMIRGVSYVYFPLPATPMLDFIQEIYGINPRWPVKEYEDANFWPELGDGGERFRPWMGREEYEDIVSQAVAFRERWRYPREPPYKLDEVLND